MAGCHRIPVLVKLQIVALVHLNEKQVACQTHARMPL